MSGMTDAVPPPDAPSSAPSSTPPPPSGADWRPPRTSQSNLGAIVVGGFFIVIGVWFFLERTLGFELPDIRWGSLWPILLIVIGGVILFRAARDRT